MSKPNDTWSIKQLRDYVTSKKLNKPAIKLSMGKADLVAGLKKHGHWESGKAKRTGGAPTHKIADKKAYVSKNQPKIDAHKKKKAIEKDKKPVVKKPAVKKPVVKKPAVKKPAVKKPAPEKLSGGEEYKSMSVKELNAVLDSMEGTNSKGGGSKEAKIQKILRHRKGGKKPESKPAPSKKSVKPKERAKAGTTTATLQDMPMDISSMIGKHAEELRGINKATSGFDDFMNYMEDSDDFTDERYEREYNLAENHTWGSDFYRVLNKLKGSKAGKDSYEDLSESQKDEFLMVSNDLVREDHDSYLKNLWKKNVKGKKYKSGKQLIDEFMDKYRND
tara:strand:- start:2504 stop:3502 length:999 start_codon:yes stop_codon:yes gene_type:complete